MKPVTIVVLSRYWDIFTGFRQSAERFAPNCARILVLDPGGEPWPALDPLDWPVITAPSPFRMARNANLGVNAVFSNSDVLYCGDDIRFLESDTVERLQKIAYDRPKLGILSPRLAGRGSSALMNPQSECDSVTPIDMWFPCVYLKREVIAKVGSWDERFDSFGDDFDYCVRALFAGYELGVTNRVTVQHGADSAHPPTFYRAGGDETALKARTRLRLAEKYRITPSLLDEYFRTGNLALLQQ